MHKPCRLLMSIENLSTSKYSHPLTNFAYQSKLRNIRVLTLPVYMNDEKLTMNVKLDFITCKAPNCNFSSSILTLIAMMLLAIPSGFE